MPDFSDSAPRSAKLALTIATLTSLGMCIAILLIDWVRTS